MAATAEYETGDFVFFKGSFEASTIICEATGSKFHHIAMVYQDPENSMLFLWHSVSDGTDLYPLHKYIEKHQRTTKNSAGYLRKLAASKEERLSLAWSLKKTIFDLKPSRYFNILSDVSFFSPDHQICFSMVLGYVNGRFLNQTITVFDPDTEKQEFTCSGLIAKTLILIEAMNEDRVHDAYCPDSFAPPEERKTIIWMEDHLTGQFRWNNCLHTLWENEDTFVDTPGSSTLPSEPTSLITNIFREKFKHILTDLQNLSNEK